MRFQWRMAPSLRRCGGKVTISRPCLHFAQGQVVEAIFCSIALPQAVDGWIIIHLSGECSADLLQPLPSAAVGKKTVVADAYEAIG